MRSPCSAISPQSESLGEEKCTEGAVSPLARGVGPTAGVEVAATMVACESRFEDVAAIAVCESVECCDRPCCRRPAIIVTTTKARMRMDLPSEISSAYRPTSADASATCDQAN